MITRKQDGQIAERDVSHLLLAEDSKMINYEQQKGT